MKTIGYGTLILSTVVIISVLVNNYYYKKHQRELKKTKIESIK